ncbi:hypothetical protein Moror_10158 [Moniliophthora roreri MCA 2997]|uniref:Uncharacterized protein n=1 Tax=Moniliophthora roreri (strain MCA 2997) TaxID=1381753 RepID=V2WS39_MONRO|nr:hypothetical protein Moror_10158 [Moniliophthora roreri MCA 2997]
MLDALCTPPNTPTALLNLPTTPPNSPTSLPSNITHTLELKKHKTYARMVCGGPPKKQKKAASEIDPEQTDDTRANKSQMAHIMMPVNQPKPCPMPKSGFNVEAHCQQVKKIYKDFKIKEPCNEMEKARRIVNQAVEVLASHEYVHGAEAVQAALSIPFNVDVKIMSMGP